VAFTPWIALEGYRDLLECIAKLELIENVAPVQYGIRLLIPEGSRLLDVSDDDAVRHPFRRRCLCYAGNTGSHGRQLAEGRGAAVKESLCKRGAGSRSAVFKEVCRPSGGT